MTRRFLLIVVLTCVVAAVTHGDRLSADNRPNVLLILSDDHSYPHVSCYDDPNTKRFKVTPNLEKFAQQGMRFDRAYTTAPQCAPSRISIFACRSPVGLGVTRFAQPPRADVRFFTDVLRDGGYWVGLDGRHQHLDGRVRESEHIDNALRSAGMQDLDKRFDHFVRSSGTKGDNLGQVSSRVAAALDKVPEDKPFFLYFGFSQPHRKFASKYDGIVPSELKLPADWPDLPEVRIDYARYLASVREMDEGFGQIMELLKTRNLEDTLVIFMGDNGEALLRGKGTLHDRGTHVPLVIRWPGRVKPGSSCSTLVSGTDLGPTILSICGMQPLSEMTGVRFAKQLTGEKPESERTYVFAERGWHWGPITRTDGLDLSRSITSNRYRYIYNALPNRSYTPVDMHGKDAWKAIQSAHSANKLSPLHSRLYFQNPRPLIELYDLQSDPLELKNLAGTKSLRGVEKTLREELESWMIREHDYLPLPTHALQNLR